MKLFRRILIFLMVIFLSSCSAEIINQVECEKYENHLWENDNVSLTTCFILEQKVDKSGFKVSNTPDDNITGLWFDHNKDIHYLPENIAEKFPKLAGLSAEVCSIKVIGRENFRGLTELKYLWLTQNLIEMIPSDTFNDLVALQTLHLSKNKIKYMNGALFAHSPSLLFVDVIDNVCINEIFNRDRIVVLSDQISKRCGNIDESLLINFIDQCRDQTLKSENELSSCRSIAVNESTSQGGLKHVHDKLEALISNQLLQKDILQKFIEEEKNKDVQIKTANEKLQKAENEISKLRSQIENADKKSI